MRSIGLPGVSFGGVSRRDGWSATARSAYQMGIERRDGVVQDKHRNGHRVDHVGHWLFLPDGVDPKVWTLEAVWGAAGAIERRRDAREGRFFDINWPRELPPDRIDGFVQELYRTFVEMELAVQIDWEISPAGDGLANDHLHALISTRALSNTGFSRSKCRALDSWFRTGVRQRVADLFNAIAQDCGVEVRFDPAPNAARENPLPPEDRLPRRVVRDRAAPGADSLLSRRDRQRALRREHEQVMVQMKMLERQERDLRREIDAQLEGMGVLTSWQSEGQDDKPLPVEITMTAFMNAGVVADERIAVEGVGVAFVIGRTMLIDAGTRIFMDGDPGDNAVRAVHILARRKGWRDLGLTDPDGMPLPVPPDPGSPGPSRVVRERSHIELVGKDSTVRAAQEVLRTIRKADPDGRREILAKVVAWGNPRLERLVAGLVSSDKEPNELSVEVVLDLIDGAMGEDDGLWRRHVLEQDLEAMTIPGTPLSRPFRPHPRFYDLYPLRLDINPRHDHAPAGGGEVLQ